MDSIVEAITSDAIMKRHCLDTNSICVLAITDSENQQETVDILNALKAKKDTFEYGWIHASQSSDIIRTLQLPEDYPSLFILHPTKQAYRNYVGAFDKDKIGQWLDSLKMMDAWSFKGDIKLTEKREHDEL